VSLVTDDNAEPIARTAERIRRSVATARRLCREGKLPHRKDRSGRLWSSRDAALAFLGVEASTAERSPAEWKSDAQNALRA
jgi:hypothetical protein